MSHSAEVVRERGHPVDAAARLERDHRAVPVAEQPRRDGVVGMRRAGPGSAPTRPSRSRLEERRQRGGVRRARRASAAAASGRRAARGSSRTGSPPGRTCRSACGSGRSAPAVPRPRPTPRRRARRGTSSRRGATRSAPCSSGRSSAGPRNVLSATTDEPVAVRERRDRVEVGDPQPRVRRASRGTAACVAGVIAASTAARSRHVDRA